MRKMIINGDSTTIIHYLKTSKLPWDVKNLARKTKAAMKEFDAVDIKHCYREGNALAYALPGRTTSERGVEFDCASFGIIPRNYIHRCEWEIVGERIRFC